MLLTGARYGALLPIGIVAQTLARDPVAVGCSHGIRWSEGKNWPAMDVKQGDIQARVADFSKLS